MTYLGKLFVVEGDRFVLDQLIEEWGAYTKQLKEPDERLAGFAKETPAKEAEARAILEYDPRRGPGDDRRGGQRAG